MFIKKFILMKKLIKTPPNYSSLSRYTFLSDVADIKVDFYSLPFEFLITQI